MNNKKLPQKQSSSDDEFEDFEDTDEGVGQNNNAKQELETTKRSITPNLDRNVINMDRRPSQDTQIEQVHAQDVEQDRRVTESIQDKNYLSTLSNAANINGNQPHQKEFQTSKSQDRLLSNNKKTLGKTINNSKKPTTTKPTTTKLYDTLQQTNTFNQTNQQHFATIQSESLHHDDPEYEQDFNKAYLKLVEKVYTTQGQNILISQDELNKIAYKQQLSVDDFNQRNQQCLENKVQKTKILEEILSAQEMQQCTFKPQTYSVKQKRNFDQFLKDQQQFEEQRLKKQKDRKEIIQVMKSQELKHQPKVNKKSARIVMDKKDNESGMIPVHQRLHNIHHEKMKNQALKILHQHEVEEQRTKRPLNKVRSESNFLSAKSRERYNGKTVESVLYDDAKRRWEAQEQKKKQQQKLKEELIQSTKPPTGNNNNKYAAQKFEKEFYYVLQGVLEELLQECEDNEIDENVVLSQKINYVKLGKLLAELGFIPHNIAADSIERELLFDMWNLLNGEETNGITVLNIKKFLLAIQGISLENNDNTKLSQQKSRQSEMSSLSSKHLVQLTFDDNGVLRLTQADCSKIFVKFKPLYINKIQFIGQQKRTSYVDNKCTFKPQINKNTEQLAMQKRIKLLASDQAEGEGEIDPTKVDLVQILLHPSHTDQQWKDQAKQILEKKEFEECTFKPKILGNQYESNNLSKSKSQSRIDKCLELYSRAKPLQEKKEKTQQQAQENEKATDECTFQPNIHISQKHYDNFYQSKCMGLSDYQSESDSMSMTQNIRGFEVVMNRLKRGREQKEIEKTMLSRGIPGTVTDESLMPPMHITPNQNYKGTFSNYSNTNENYQAYNTNKLSSSKSTENLNNTSSARRTKDSRRHTQTFDKGGLKENMNITNQGEHSKSNLFKDPKQQNDKRQSKNPRYSEEFYNYDFNNGEKQIEEIEEVESPITLVGKAKQPLLYVDVNLGPGKSERIVVFDGDTADSLADSFSQKHSLDANMRYKLCQLLDSQIAGLLEKIDEEQNSIHSDIL